MHSRFAKRFWFFTSGLALATLTSCENGAVTDSPPPNQAPSFTSAAIATIAENAALGYRAAATDPNGDPLTYSIVGGADAARFTITAAGLVNFATPPDFERPTDAGANNVYDVQLGVSDGRLGTAGLNLQVTVTNILDAVTREIGSGFVNPVGAQWAGGSLYVAEPGSVIRLATDGSGTKTPMIGTPGAASRPDGSVIIAFAIGPITNYPVPGEGVHQAAIVMRRDVAGRILVDYYYAQNDPWVFRRIIATRNLPAGAQIGNANGALHIADGNLYMAYGDAGIEDLAQQAGSGWGALYCGVPASYYRIPLDQVVSVFACGGGPSGGPTLIASGLRLPSGGWGDRGEAWQELNQQMPARNFGWPYRDGTAQRRSGGPAAFDNPVLQYRTGDGENEGRGIVPGFRYQGLVPAFLNQYLFGDVSGKIWSVPASAVVAGQTLESASFVRRNAQLNIETGTIDRLAALLQNDSGNIYIVDGLDGQVFETVAR